MYVSYIKKEHVFIYGMLYVLITIDSKIKTFDQELSPCL